MHPAEHDLKPLFDALLVEFHRAADEATSLRSMLDAAIHEVALSIGTNSKLSEKLKLVLGQFRTLRSEAFAMRTECDVALAELAITMPERAQVIERVAAVVAACRRATERERSLKEAVRKQHASLHHAYHRCKEVEIELQRSQGAAAEQRDALVHSSLHALHQLRQHLGAIHALRPEVSKQLDEALYVKGALAPSRLALSASLPHLPTHGATSASLTALEGAAPPRIAVGASGIGKEGMSTTLMEQFLEKITAESAALVTGLPPNWIQAASRPNFERDGASARMQPPDSPGRSTRRNNTGSPSPYASPSRPFTPLNVALERSRPSNMLRVPQPGSSKKAKSERPSETLVANYETIRSHLNAARSLANF
jgi:hypothetical protein